MSLRMIIQPGQIQQWINERNGTPARRCGRAVELRIHFGDTADGFEKLTMDELIEAMRFQHLVLLVDEAPGQTFHQFVARG